MRAYAPIRGRAARCAARRTDGGPCAERHKALRVRQRRRIRRGRARCRAHSAYGTLLGVHQNGAATREL